MMQPPHYLLCGCIILGTEEFSKIVNEGKYHDRQG